jgi:hypothetical protein
MMGCGPLVQTVTNIKKRNLQKNFKTEIQELPKFVEAYVGLTLTY